MKDDLRVLADAVTLIAAPDGPAAFDVRYRQYEACRLRGDAHEDIAHRFRDADALRQRFVDAWNSGARQADDVVKVTLPPPPSRESTPDGRTFRAGE